jgi:hypothetical protein
VNSDTFAIGYGCDAEQNDVARRFQRISCRKGMMEAIFNVLVISDLAIFPLETGATTQHSGRFL